MSAQALMSGVAYNLLDAVASGTTTGASVALLPRANLITWQTIFGTEPASITVEMQVSNDDENFSVVASSTTVGGEVGTFQTSAKHLRAVIGAISGGDDITVMVVAKPI